jgi:hypothetical protein
MIRSKTFSTVLWEKSVAKITKPRQCNSGSQRERLFRKTQRKRYKKNGEAETKNRKKFSSG